MITEIAQITKGPVLLDFSALMSAVFTDKREANVGRSSECSYLLERCAEFQVHGYIAPEAVTRLWKIFCTVSDGLETKLLPQKPAVSTIYQTANRMKAFSKSPFHILRISSATLERSVDLWEKTGAGIEACVAISAFREVVPAPHIVVTANNHYIELIKDNVLVIKPKLSQDGTQFITRPPEAFDRGSLMIS